MTIIKSPQIANVGENMEGKVTPVYLGIYIDCSHYGKQNGGSSENWKQTYFMI